MLNDFLPISAERLFLANFLIQSTVKQDNHRMLYSQYRLEETRRDSLPSTTILPHLDYCPGLTNQLSGNE